MPCPVVGIGASAGGLAANSALLAELPAATGMAFVLVQHLDPAHASSLAEILGKRAAMPVVEARNGMAVEADHFYIIPPNATLRLAGETLSVTEREGRGHNPGPIDTFFLSLASERGSRAAGVLLSGGGSDGTRGAQEIKETGGVVLAQEPDSAAFESMPLSAIRAGATHAVLPPADLARRLAQLASRLIAGEGTWPDEGAANRELWTRIFRLLRGASSIDFTHYKKSTLQRRVARRMGFKQIAELAAYAQLLEQDQAELNALAQDLLIGVTSFFRDPGSFEDLSRTVLPALLAGRKPHEPLRVWVPGCSSGEELYSIAICVLEQLGEHTARTTVKMFGTDASEAAIARARDARYPAGIAADVSPERLERWFVRIDGHYQIAKPLRDLCVFARHDVIRDPPFSRIDILSCRNLLIYMEGALQRQVFAHFQYALNPGGFLLLGPSEAIGASADLFEPIEKNRRVLRRRDVPGNGARIRTAHAPAPALRIGPPAPAGREDLALDRDRLQREADRLLLARYAPAAIVVDDDLNVHQFRGDTGPFLAHAPGAASLNLQKLAPPALLVALVPALREARSARAGASVRRKDVRIEVHGRERRVEFEVNPFRLPEDVRPCYLVTLAESGSAPPRGLWDTLVGAVARRVASPDAVPTELDELRRELAATREVLQSSTDEHEAVKEELKSMNEEALSANEELQSTNEELETSKEELQSTNEEIATTNDELRARNQQLDDAREDLVAARDYAEAIVLTVRHPLLVLDAGLRVVSANPAFYRLFRVEPFATQGKFLYDLGNRQWDIPALRTLLEDTLGKSEAIDDYRVQHTFPDLGERVMMLNARKIVPKEGAAHLILLGIEDASERLSHHAALQDADRRKDEFLAMLGHELRNPLAPIRSSLDTIRGIEIRDQPLRKCFEVIERQSGHMARLVDDLLEMSRIASGRLALESEDVVLGDAVKRAVETAYPLIEARKHSLRIENSAPSLVVRGDMVRLTQVFTNLLNNAAKYTPAAGAIGLSVAGEGTHAVVTVADNGQGIDAEKLPHIFEPFAQNPERSRTGLGIGLALARRLAELHGGTIEATSGGPGKGSAFTVRLPLAKQAQPAPSHPAAPADAPDLKGCKVLIVDDNVDAAQMLQVFLESTGCDARCAFDGESALPIAENFAPEVVLLDLALPGIDGYEVLRRLRAGAGVGSAVIALTGYTQPADLARMTVAGFDHSLRKPVDAEALTRAIASAWPKRHSSGL